MIFEEVYGNLGDVSFYSMQSHSMTATTKRKKKKIINVSTRTKSLQKVAPSNKRYKPCKTCLVALECSHLEKINFLFQSTRTKFIAGTKLRRITRPHFAIRKRTTKRTSSRDPASPIFGRYQKGLAIPTKSCKTAGPPKTAQDHQTVHLYHGKRMKR